MTDNSCTIGLGSNSPDRDKLIKTAISSLEQYLASSQVSSIYECPASNGKDAPYLNAVIHGMTPHTQEELVAHLKRLEVDAGRTDQLREQGVVPMDLDLVIWNFRIIRPEDFQRIYFNIGYRELLSKGAFETM